MSQRTQNNSLPATYIRKRFINYLLLAQIRTPQKESKQKTRN